MEPFSSSLGFCRNWRLHGCWLMLGMVTSSYGYDNFCIERHYPEARTSTYCQGMTLPAEMTRNFLYERWSLRLLTLTFRFLKIVNN